MEMSNINQNYLRLIFVAVGSATANGLSKYLTNLDYSPLFILALSVIPAIVIYYFLENIFIDLPMQNSFLRSKWEPKAIIEGNWIESYIKEGKNFYGLVKIYYDVKEKTFSMNGYAHDSNGEIHSEWNSDDININLKNNKLKYAFEAEMFVERGENIIGHGVINFSPAIENGKYVWGTGYFVDSGTELRKCNYEIKRIDTDLIQKLIGKKILSPGDDTKKFIKMYHKNKAP